MVNDDRKSEKLGWILCWSGGFLWALILAFVYLARGASVPALVGCALVAAAAASGFLFAPWRNPRTRYGKPMLSVYALLFLMVAWAAWIAGGAAQFGLSGWSLLFLLPLLLPFCLARRRRWIDGWQQTG